MRTYAFDTETWPFWDGCMAPPVVCLSLARGSYSRLASRRWGRRWFRAAVTRPDVVLIGHNVAYDLAAMVALDPDLLPTVWGALEAGRIKDTKVREQLLSIARGREDEEKLKASLGDLVHKYLGKDIGASKKGPDAWRLRYRELDGKPIGSWPVAAREYPHDDARHALQVYEAQAREANGRPDVGNLHDETRSVLNAWVLHLVTLWGLRTDPAAVEALDQKVTATDAANQVVARKLGFVGPDGTEDLATVRAAVERAYNGSPPRTGKGAIKHDRDTLAESGDAVLAAYAKAGKNDKYLSTYLPKIRKGVAAPINPQFYGMAATTRVTSDYQQLPQKGGIRESHRARPGFVYCSIDYEGLELRTMAQRAIWHPEVGFSDMGDALLAGKDVHTLAAAEFLSVPYEELLPRVKVKEPAADGMRALAKVFNFGKGGGMGPKSLVYNARAKDDVRFCLLAKRADTCGSQGMTTITVRGQEKRVCTLCVTVATELDAGWLAAWREQKALFAISSRMHRYGTRSTVEIPYINVKRGKCGYTQWLNTPFQGLGAVLCTEAMRAISKETYLERSSPLYGSRIVLNVHDELVLEIKDESPTQRHDAAERAAFLMREPAKRILPDLAPSVRAEPALSMVLSKYATTIRDESGLLQVWQGA
jgi:DNA polymerase-1